MTYELLCGEMPFKGTSFEQVQERILTEQPSFDGRIWSKVSEECKDLLKHMLCKDIQ